MSIKEKINDLKNIFFNISDPQEKYRKIMEMGKSLEQLDPKLQSEENRVKGCQSNAFINTIYKNGNIYVSGASDALISAGLLAVLIAVYNNESPQDILQSPATFLIEIGLEEAISPNRANGLYDAHLLLKKKALEHLMKNPQK